MLEPDSTPAPITRRRYIAWGLAMAVLALALDQFSKWVMLYPVQIETKQQIEITSFFKLVMVWNEGVSFGMFSSGNAIWFLIAVAFAIIIFMASWLLRATDRWVASAIGLIIGGALGNVTDRLRFGAVADFFDFHLMGYHYPAFNIADSCIFIGVALLIWDGVMRKKPSAGNG